MTTYPIGEDPAARNLLSGVSGSQPARACPSANDSSDPALELLRLGRLTPSPPAPARRRPRFGCFLGPRTPFPLPFPADACALSPISSSLQSACLGCCPRRRLRLAESGSPVVPIAGRPRPAPPARLADGGAAALAAGATAAAAVAAAAACALAKLAAADEEGEALAVAVAAAVAAACGLEALAGCRGLEVVGCATPSTSMRLRGGRPGQKCGEKRGSVSQGGHEGSKRKGPDAREMDYRFEAVEMSRLLDLHESERARLVKEERRKTQ